MSAKKGNQNRAKYLDTNLLARVCLHARNGKSKTDCFKLVGVHPDSGFLWLKRGREGDQVGDGVLIRFERVFERCVAHFNATRIELINAAANSGAPNTWQAAAWMLERRDPANWGRRDVTKIEGGDGGPIIQLNQVVLVDGDARDAARALLRRVAGAGADESLGVGVGGELEEDTSAGPESVIVDSRATRRLPR